MSSTTSSPRDVIVIGAGFAGLYAVHASRRAGLDVVCFEAGAGVGGTWYFNQYPGARCDVQSIDYSYSFDDELQDEWVWSERYATQPEILSYMNHVAERFDLLRDIQLSNAVLSAHFDEERSLWKVATQDGSEHWTRNLVAATGVLSIPNKPNIPGIEDFAGEVLFTAQWPAEEPSLAGKRVGLIGTGSSGIQVTPILAARAEHLTVFQRTPNWSVPAFNRPYTDEDQKEIREGYPERRRKSRVSGGGSTFVTHSKRGVDCTPEEAREVLEQSWRSGGTLFAKAFPDQMSDLAANDIARTFAEEKIRERINDPEVARKLIPDHPLGAKRIVTDSHYFETFNRDNVDLVSLREDPISSVAPWGIKTKDSSYEVDVLVFATGFDAVTGALARIDLRGVDGIPLSEVWSEGPKAYLGIFVPSFPNLFLINGPDSPGVLANMVMHSELQFDWVLDLIQEASARGAQTVEARSDVTEKWTEHVDELANATVFVTTDSWYLGSNIEGKPRKFMIYTGGLGTYMEVCRGVAEREYEGLVFTSREQSSQLA